MTTTDESALHTGCPVLPYPPPREEPLHPPRALTDLHAGPAAGRIRLWDGSEVWLVTGHAHARALLGDPRLTAVTSAPGFPMMTPTSTLVRDQPRSASFIRMDNPEHARLRSMLSREFLPRQVEAHRPAVRAVLDDVFAGLADRRGEAVDLVRHVALPVPARVVADLLAVPEEDLAFFVERSAVLIDRSFSPSRCRRPARTSTPTSPRSPNAACSSRGTTSSAGSSPPTSPPVPCRWPMPSR